MATSATQHNYRLALTPNADPDWGGLNEEYLNHEQRKLLALGQRAHC